MPRISRRPVALTSTALAVAVLAGAMAAAGQGDDWLPPRVAEGVAAQLADRLGTLGNDPNHTELMAGAQRMVAALRAELDEAGFEAVAQRAPVFEGLEVPSVENPWLDAITRYQLCNANLLVQLGDPAIRDNPNTTIMATFGLTAVTTTTLFLRHPYIEGGGTQDELSAQLTSADLEPIVEAMQTDDAVRTAVTATCGPVVRGLLEGPLQAAQPDAGG